MMKSIANYGVFMILFVCVSITVVGNGCDENESTPRALTSTSAEMTEFNELYELQKEYFSPKYARNAALIMIAQSIDRLTDAVKEHECLSK